MQYFLAFVVLSLGKPWHKNVMIQYSLTLAPAGNLSECWIRYLMPASTLGKTDDPIVIPIINFSTVPDFSVDFTKLL